jgi:hypothetical protein
MAHVSYSLCVIIFKELISIILHVIEKREVFLL